MIQEGIHYPLAFGRSDPEIRENYTWARNEPLSLRCLGKEWGEPAWSNGANFGTIQGMETISRNITDLAADERVAFERFLGTHLTENQRIIVQVMDVGADNGSEPPRTAADYAILSDLDDETADRLTDAMLQRSPGRDISL